MRISILTPAFNSGAYLEKAIQSVLAQNDPDFEHIIVDGGSKDETLTVLKRYPYLKWVSERDRGQCDAMNKAFAWSTGQIIAYLNADDWFEPGVFAHVRDCFARHTEMDMVIGNFYSKSEGDAMAHLRVPVKDYRSTLLFFRHVWPLNPVCYFYRRTVQEAVGEFPVEVHIGMDYWFLIRAMAKARIYASDVVFGTYYFPPESKTSRGSGLADIQQGAQRFRKWVRQHLRESDLRLLAWWDMHWFLHHWVREFPERAKAPFRYLAYKALFASMLDYHEYENTGFRRVYRKRFPRQ
jgi:glycosyltransferase involved in cell wall biosynthesis